MNIQVDIDIDDVIDQLDNEDLVSELRSRAKREKKTLSEFIQESEFGDDKDEILNSFCDIERLSLSQSIELKEFIKNLKK